ncbi:LOW QUALITY PROTEIN: hypothetical protein U9M48_027434, partial [Paspalum notatum var. saurae]
VVGSSHPPLLRICQLRTNVVASILRFRACQSQTDVVAVVLRSCTCVSCRQASSPASSAPVHTNVVAGTFFRTGVVARVLRSRPFQPRTGVIASVLRSRVFQPRTYVYQPLDGKRRASRGSKVMRDFASYHVSLLVPLCPSTLAPSSTTPKATSLLLPLRRSLGGEAAASRRPLLLQASSTPPSISGMRCSCPELDFPACDLGQRSPMRPLFGAAIPSSNSLRRGAPSSASMCRCRPSWPPAQLATRIDARDPALCCGKAPTWTPTRCSTIFSNHEKQLEPNGEPPVPVLEMGWMMTTQTTDGEELDDDHSYDGWI